MRRCSYGNYNGIIYISWHYSMSICPQCFASGLYRINPYDKIICPLCEGRLEVSSLVLAEWHMLKPNAPLPSKIQTKKEDVTLVSCPRCKNELYSRFKDCGLCDGTKLVEPIICARWKFFNGELKA